MSALLTFSLLLLFICRYYKSIEVSDVPELAERYQLKQDTHQFIITKTTASDDGEYECRTNGKTAIINVVGKLYMYWQSNHISLFINYLEFLDDS